jgi:H+/Cl- antiporter ClcA
VPRFTLTPRLKAKIAAATLAAIFPYLMLVWASGGNDRFSWSAFALYVPVAAIFGAFGWWAAQSWQLLWRQGDNKWERVVYNYGVRGFGICMALAIPTILGCFGASSGDGTTDSLRWLVGGVFFGVVFGLPVCLHLGYFWGVAFAKFNGIAKP